MSKNEILEIAVAKEIWKICKISPDHGNAVMDLVGEEVYQKISKLQSKDIKVD